jgi:hypothetical protein
VTEARFKVMAYTINDLMIMTKEKYKEIHEFSGRRADIFCLDTGEIVEIETGKSYEKKDDVIVVRI